MIVLIWNYQMKSCNAGPYNTSHSNNSFSLILDPCLIMLCAPQRPSNDVTLPDTLTLSILFFWNVNPIQIQIVFSKWINNAILIPQFLERVRSRSYKILNAVIFDDKIIERIPKRLSTSNNEIICF